LRCIISGLEPLGWSHHVSAVRTDSDVVSAQKSAH
jgi:hypothetical protein